MNSLPLIDRAEPFTQSQQSRLLVAVTAGSIAIHFPEQQIQLLIPNIITNAPDWLIPLFNSLRAVIFFFVTVYLGWTIAKPIKKFLMESRIRCTLRDVFRNSALSFFIIGALTFPAALGIMGVGYAHMSENPFRYVDASYQLYQRLMMPALAYFFQFQGIVLYHMFSLVLTLLVIIAVQLFFIQRNRTMTPLEMVSFGTTTMIITQFQSPGYTDSLLFLCVMVLLTVPTNSLERMALSAVALFAHEGSVLLIGAIAVILFRKDERRMYGVMVFVYALVWFASFRFDPAALLSVRLVGGLSGIEWLVREPLRATLGLFLSYKLLWIVLGISLYSFRKNSRETVILLLPGILAVAAAVDTTRLLALSFIPFLYAMEYVQRFTLVSKKTYSLILWLNIIFPSLYVGLNSGIVVFDGLYQFLYFGYLLK